MSETTRSSNLSARWFDFWKRRDTTWLLQHVTNGASAPACERLQPLVRCDARIITGSWISSDRMSGIVVSLWQKVQGSHCSHASLSCDFLRRLILITRQRERKDEGGVLMYFNEVFQRFFSTRCNNWKFFLPVNTGFVPFWLGSISSRPCDSDSTKIIKRGKWRQFCFPSDVA